MSTRDNSSPRFTLVGLFEIIAGIALVLALLRFAAFGLAVIGFAGVVLFYADYLVWSSDPDRGQQNLLNGFLFLAALGVMASCLVPEFDEREPSPGTGRCRENLRSLAAALQRYQAEHGEFPPVVKSFDDGRPDCSWRVLILPYLGEEDLYASYDFREPWNGPNNSKLAARIPGVFRCPSARSPEGMTNYFRITGPGRDYRQRSDFKDRRTILLVESSNAEVSWLEPRDLTVEELVQNTAQGRPPCACSNHTRETPTTWSAGWFHAAFQDKSVRAFPQEIDADALRAYLTIDGGEPVRVHSVREKLRGEVWLLLSFTALFVLFFITRRVLLARRMRRA